MDEVAIQRLDRLLHTLSSVQAPAVLLEYVRAMQGFVQQQQYPSSTMVRFLALFETLYAETYARQPASGPWVFFQLGAWLENLSLAAAAGETVVLQQEQVLKSLADALQQLHAPAEILRLFGRLQALVTHPQLSTEELPAIRALIRDLQRQFHG